MDARPLTLRWLVWASEARQEMEWQRTARLEAAIIRPWTKERINPEDLNPYRRKPALKRLTQMEREAESKAGWELLRQYFTGRN